MHDDVPEVRRPWLVLSVGCSIIGLGFLALIVVAAMLADALT